VGKGKREWCLVVGEGMLRDNIEVNRSGASIVRLRRELMNSRPIDGI